MTALATRLMDRILRTMHGVHGVVRVVPVDASRLAAARFSRGNVAVQLDAFVSEESFARERSEVSAISLPE